MRTSSTRQQIIEAADELFYQHGFDHTSFADIAEVVNISRGNFYHHFKSKDDILEEVIVTRLEKTKGMLEEWEQQSCTPKERIKSYINILLANWSDIKEYGCPVGTLCTELAKLNHSSLDDASRVFTLFREWLKNQFVQLGFKEKADEYAMNVLSWSQGVATMGNAFRDRKFVKREVEKMSNWLDSLVEENKTKLKRNSKKQRGV